MAAWICFVSTILVCFTCCFIEYSSSDGHLVSRWIIHTNITDDLSNVTVSSTSSSEEPLTSHNFRWRLKISGAWKTLRELKTTCVGAHFGVCTSGNLFISGLSTKSRVQHDFMGQYLLQNVTSELRPVYRQLKSTAILFFYNGIWVFRRNINSTGISMFNRDPALFPELVLQPWTVFNGYGLRRERLAISCMGMLDSKIIVVAVSGKNKEVGCIKVHKDNVTKLKKNDSLVTEETSDAEGVQGLTEQGSRQVTVMHDKKHDEPDEHVTTSVEMPVASLKLSSTDSSPAESVTSQVLLEDFPHRLFDKDIRSNRIGIDESAESPSMPDTKFSDQKNSSLNNTGLLDQDMNVTIEFHGNPADDNGLDISVDKWGGITTSVSKEKNPVQYSETPLEAVHNESSMELVLESSTATFLNDESVDHIDRETTNIGPSLKKAEGKSVSARGIVTTSHPFSEDFGWVTTASPETTETFSNTGSSLRDRVNGLGKTKGIAAIVNLNGKGDSGEWHGRNAGENNTKLIINVTKVMYEEALGVTELLDEVKDLDKKYPRAKEMSVHEGNMTEGYHLNVVGAENVNASYMNHSNESSNHFDGSSDHNSNSTKTMSDIWESGPTITAWHEIGPSTMLPVEVTLMPNDTLLYSTKERDGTPNTRSSLLIKVLTTPNINAKSTYSGVDHTEPSRQEVVDGADEKQDDNCENALCSNGGESYVDEQGLIACTCAKGFFGPRCEKEIRCGEPPVARSAILERVVETGPISLAFYSCEAGYIIQGRNAAVCGPAGQWNRPPRCITYMPVGQEWSQMSPLKK